MISESASVPQLADKALQTATAIKEIELQEKSELGRNLGLNEAQMRAIFDETLGDSRQAAQRSQFANFAALGAGLLVLLAAAGASLFGGSKDPWTFATGGMGAAALIAALVTSPSKRIGSSASRQVYIQTAYFSFLQQVRLLNSLSPDTTLQRSERLEGATDKLLERLKSLPGDQ
jgi:type IV secretory pathway TrbF-like protein